MLINVVIKSFDFILLINSHRRLRNFKLLLNLIWPFAMLIVIYFNASVIFAYHLNSLKTFFDFIYVPVTVLVHIICILETAIYARVDTHIWNEMLRLTTLRRLEKVIAVDVLVFIVVPLVANIYTMFATYEDNFPWSLGIGVRIWSSFAISLYNLSYVFYMRYQQLLMADIVDEVERRKCSVSELIAYKFTIAQIFEMQKLQKSTYSVSNHFLFPYNLCCMMSSLYYIVLKIMSKKIGLVTGEILYFHVFFKILKSFCCRIRHVCDTFFQHDFDVFYCRGSTECSGGYFGDVCRHGWGGMCWYLVGIDGHFW